MGVTGCWMVANAGSPIVWKPVSLWFLLMQIQAKDIEAGWGPLDAPLDLILCHS